MRTAAYNADVASDRRRRKNVPRHILCSLGENAMDDKKIKAEHYIDINHNLKDELGRLKAEYTIEGMHINEDGYRAIYDDIMKYVKE